MCNREVWFFTEFDIGRYMHCAHTYMYSWMSTHIHTCVHVHSYNRMQRHAHVHTHRYSWISTHKCTQTHSHTYHTNECTHTHKHRSRLAGDVTCVSDILRWLWCCCDLHRLTVVTEPSCWLPLKSQAVSALCYRKAGEE